MSSSTQSSQASSSFSAKVDELVENVDTQWNPGPDMALQKPVILNRIKKFAPILKHAWEASLQEGYRHPHPSFSQTLLDFENSVLNTDIDCELAKIIHTTTTDVFERIWNARKPKKSFPVDLNQLNDIKSKVTAMKQQVMSLNDQGIEMLYQMNPTPDNFEFMFEAFCLFFDLPCKLREEDDLHEDCDEDENHEDCDKDFCCEEDQDLDGDPIHILNLNIECRYEPPPFDDQLLFRILSSRYQKLTFLGCDADDIIIFEYTYSKKN